jgi:hypothetical protein
MHGSRNKTPSKNLVNIYTLNFWLYLEFHMQGVPGGMDKTWGECYVMLNYTDITQNTDIQS